MEERTVDGEEFDFEHSNLVPPPTKIPSYSAEAWLVAARNQVCLHMEMYGSGTEGGSSGGPGGASLAALCSPSGRLLTGP